VPEKVCLLEKGILRNWNKGAFVVDLAWAQSAAHNQVKGIGCREKHSDMYSNTELHCEDESYII